MFLIDNTRTAQQNLISMINFGSKEVFLGTEFTIGLPQPSIPPEPSEGTNTTLLLTSVPGEGYYNTRTIRYRRLKIGNTRPGAPTEYTVLEGETPEDLLTRIRVEHNLLESDVEFLGLRAFPEPGDSAVVTCKAELNSYFYIGSFDFTVINPAVQSPPEGDNNTAQGLPTTL